MSGNGDAVVVEVVVVGGVVVGRGVVVVVVDLIARCVVDGNSNNR